MDGIRTVYAGRGMTMWDTRAEAEDSWRAKSLHDLPERALSVWWRESDVVTVDCPPDVRLSDVMKKDL